MAKLTINEPFKAQGKHSSVTVTSETIAVDLDEGKLTFARPLEWSADIADAVRAELSEILFCTAYAIQNREERAHAAVVAKYVTAAEVSP